jgi:lipopolysaccharide export system protein LptA
VRFIKRGEMRRFKGAQLFDETSGNVIVYDNGADVFTVDSGANPGTPGTGRVRTMLTPNPAPGSAAASPATPASAAPLRQSGALSSPVNGPSK